MYTPNEPISATSNQYICRDNTTKCEPSYSDGDCNGDPMYCDESNLAYFDYIACHNWHIGDATLY